MNKDINKIDDNELESITGGAAIAPDLISRIEGGICPINGKYCKHGVISSYDGQCLKAKIGCGIKAPDPHLSRDSTKITTGEEYTFYKCDYINDQE